MEPRHFDLHMVNLGVIIAAIARVRVPYSPWAVALTLTITLTIIIHRTLPLSLGTSAVQVSSSWKQGCDRLGLDPRIGVRIQLGRRYGLWHQR